jgi:hypothetical protein
VCVGGFVGVCRCVWGVWGVGAKEIDSLDNFLYGRSFSVKHVCLCGGFVITPQTRSQYLPSVEKQTARSIFASVDWEKEPR